MVHASNYLVKVFGKCLDTSSAEQGQQIDHRIAHEDAKAKIDTCLDDVSLYHYYFIIFALVCTPKMHLNVLRHCLNSIMHTA